MNEPEIQTEQKFENDHFDLGDKLMVLFTLVLSGIFIAAAYFTEIGAI